MTGPLVSVVMTTYNHRPYVVESIESVVSQSYEPTEIVIADDGSTDGTAEIVNEYARKHPNRIVSVGGQNLGITRNAHRALSASRGVYVAFASGDDVFLPGKLAKQVEWMEADRNRVLCGHDVDVFESDTGKTVHLWSERHGLTSGQGAPNVVREVPYCGTAIMVRAASLPKGGLDDRLRVVSDWKLWIDLLRAGGEYGYVEGVYARYRRHAQNVTSMAVSANREATFVDVLKLFALVEQAYPELAPACRSGRAKFFLHEAKWSFKDGAAMRAAMFVAKAIGEDWSVFTDMATRKARQLLSPR